jgi:hypothetical protein
MDEIMRNLAPPFGVMLAAAILHVWARGLHERTAERSRRRAHPAE